MTARQLKLYNQAVKHPLRALILKNNYKDSETIAQCLNIDMSDAKRHLTILKRCGAIKYVNNDLVSQAVFRRKF